jgi:hypothetical protein
MSEQKTRPTDEDVLEFLRQVEPESRQADCHAILEMMRQATGEAPRMWGDAMIGFGQYHYRYASGHEGDTFRVGFSPRKQNLTLYLCYGVDEQADLLERLGKHKNGKGCLYIKRLADVDLDALRALIDRAAAQQSYGGG